MYPKKRAGIWHLYRVLDIATFPIGLYGFGIDGFIQKSFLYDKLNNFNVVPYKIREKNERWVNLESIKIDIDDIDKGILSYIIPHSENLLPSIEKVEEKKELKNKKIEKKEEKNLRKRKNY